MKKCRYCGFENPDTASDCLQCGKDLPKTAKEAKDAFETLGAAIRGEWGKVGRKTSEDFVKGRVEEAKLHLNPLWWLRVKLFRLKQAAIGCLIIWLIILGIVIVGAIIGKLQGK